MISLSSSESSHRITPDLALQCFISLPLEGAYPEWKPGEQPVHLYRRCLFLASGCLENVSCICAQLRVLISSRPVYLTGHRLITGRTSGFSSFCGWFAFGNVYPAGKILFVHLLSNIIPSFETNYGDNLWGFQCFIWFWKCRIRI